MEGPLPANDIALEAQAYWQKGDVFEAGKLLFEQLPNEIRQKWASGILRLVVERTGIKTGPIEYALHLADRPKNWSKAHGAFSDLRRETLLLEGVINRSRDQDLKLSLLLLAELVAKITYNATLPDDEFDEDTGWSIAPCLKDILDRLNDDTFAEVARSALFEQSC